MIAKKLFIALGFLIILAIIGLAIAPHFIDINKKIKPILTEALEKNLNAQVKIGDISLSFYGKVSIRVDSLKIKKEKIDLVINDLILTMPYSVLNQNPSQWSQNIKMSITANEISLNEGQLVVKNFKSDFSKVGSIVKLENTEFMVFDGSGKSHAEIELAQNETQTPKGTFEFQIQNGKWPADKLKQSFAKEAAIIPRAQDMISKIHMDDRFENLSGSVLFENGITTIRSISMKVPQNKADLSASGTINSKNQVNIEGNFLLPLDNVPTDLKANDGRGQIPFEVLGSVDNPYMNWRKTIEIVVRAYSKDEGKQILKKEVNKLKEKLMKDKRIKELIKGIKF